MSALQNIVVVVACWLVTPSTAQVPFSGPCPDVSVVTDFDAERYLGTWYEAQKYFALFQLGGKCVTATYTSINDTTIGVDNNQISELTGRVSEIQGYATLVGRPGEAKLSVVFPSLPVNIAAPYWVVDTDYDTYALVWGCNDFEFFNTRNAWILTREQNPAASVVEQALAAADANNISRRYFTVTDQTDCPDDNENSSY